MRPSALVAEPRGLISAFRYNINDNICVDELEGKIMVSFVASVYIAFLEPGRAHGFKAMRPAWKECHPRAKEAAGLLKRNAKLLKGYRIAPLYLFMSFIGAFGMHVMPFVLSVCADLLGPVLADTYMLSGGSAWAFDGNMVVVYGVHWTWRILAGLCAFMALMGAMFCYKHLLKEAN
jgi:hypothetical protein